MQLSKKDMKSLLENVSKTEEVELPCDEVFELIDQFADAAVRGRDPATLMPLVKHHLEMCRDCLEEYEALLRMLKAAE